MTKPIFPAKKERHVLFGSVPPVPGSKPTLKEQMTDLQNHSEDYLFAIEEVGITRVSHPITIHSTMAPRVQTTIARIELTTNLGQNSKGINMSRLTETLESYRQRGLSTDLAHLCELTKELAVVMNQSSSKLVMEFPWFYERSAPASSLIGLSHSELYIEIKYDESADQKFEITVGITTAVTTLCPCSKEISEYSAHNQRGMVTIKVSVDPLLVNASWNVLLLEAAESNASAALHPVLKRTDEKMVTERAYENPRFVEDLARLVAADLYEYDFVERFTVECRNEESIHQHDAIARITFDKRQKG
ncbi:GTP cyclohydrolase FolE2 [Paenibacillus sp. GCM10012306]|uniref:GTP cyclohydrolase FolE2 n=1 Tax=Paenibacillus sp. GCM10012306 TaxID=3317342 RepID=UPI00361C21E0